MTSCLNSKSNNPQLPNKTQDFSRGNIRVAAIIKGFGLAMLITGLIGCGESNKTITTQPEKIINTIPFLEKTITGGDYIQEIAISPDGKTLVSGNHQGQIKIWNLVETRISVIVHLRTITIWRRPIDRETQRRDCAYRCRSGF